MHYCRKWQNNLVQFHHDFLIGASNWRVTISPIFTSKRDHHSSMFSLGRAFRCCGRCNVWRGDGLSSDCFQNRFIHWMNVNNILIVGTTDAKIGFKIKQNQTWKRTESSEEKASSSCAGSFLSSSSLASSSLPPHLSKKKNSFHERVKINPIAFYFTDLDFRFEKMKWSRTLSMSSIPFGWPPRAPCSQPRKTSEDRKTYFNFSRKQLWIISFISERLQLKNWKCITIYCFGSKKNTLQPMNDRHCRSYHLSSRKQWEYEKMQDPT